MYEAIAGCVGVELVAIERLDDMDSGGICLARLGSLFGSLFLYSVPTVFFGLSVFSRRLGSCDGQ